MIDQKLRLYRELNPNELTSIQFENLAKEIEHPDPHTISDEYVDFKLWMRGLPSRQESFAEFIAKKLSKNAGASILEVGCGRTGRVSRILSRKGFLVTGIDPQLEIESDLWVMFWKEQFDYRKHVLNGFDYVIAQEPCDATEHIVRACVEQDVPFFITLCGVPHKLISGEMPKNEQEWYKYLVNIQPDTIKLRYANIDAYLPTPILKSNNF